jgi:hypothetical protein
VSAAASGAMRAVAAQKPAPPLGPPGIFQAASLTSSRSGRRDWSKSRALQSRHSEAVCPSTLIVRQRWRPTMHRSRLTSSTLLLSRRDVKPRRVAAAVRPQPERGEAGCPGRWSQRRKSSASSRAICALGRWCAHGEDRGEGRVTALRCG